MMTRYVCTEDGSNKFWEASVEGMTLTTRWGKVGTSGQAKTKTFPTEIAARAELARLEKEKLGKGYVAEASAFPAVVAQVASPALPASAAIPATRAKAKAAEFPFLFYVGAPATHTRVTSSTTCASSTRRARRRSRSSPRSS
jgi:predicted DNA-binding WGR domain protein